MTPGDPAGQLETFARRRDCIRQEMGGRAKVERLHEAGGMTVRELITELSDEGSFLELGTFVSAGDDRTPCDGVIGGLARIGERPVVVAGFDATVKGGAEGRNGQRKLRKLYDKALRTCSPLVIFGNAAGARVAEVMGSAGMTSGPAFIRGGGADWLAGRDRAVPLISVIVGRSYGESSFIAALSDVTIQLSGTVLAVASPRVIEAATGEAVSEEELGGRHVQESQVGQADLGADTPAAAIAATRMLLGFLPGSCWELPPRQAWPGPADAPDPHLAAVVPADRRRAYDMRRLIRRLVDDGDILELRPQYGRSVLTLLARVRGMPVGIVASQPTQGAGAISPAACEKMTRFICLCDSFNLPIVTLVDSPGVLVGRAAEHDRLLYRAMLLQQAIGHASVPRVTVLVRKAYGLALFAMSGPNTGTAAVLAWPGAEIGFMDPEVAVRVLHPDAGAASSVLAADVAGDVSPYGAASQMAVDEIIDPADTRDVIADVLSRAVRGIRPGRGVLRQWPTCW